MKINLFLETEAGGKKNDDERGWESRKRGQK
jgi:hypothetical protein